MTSEQPDLFIGDPAPAHMRPSTGFRARKSIPTARGIVFSTSAGYVAIGVDEQNRLAEATFPRVDAEEAAASLHFSNLRSIDEGDPVLGLVSQIRDYLDGTPMTFDWEMNLSGLTPFQQEALRICATIPYGELRSYGWIAAEMGRPKSARPVGGAMGVNPIPILIPCHRVVGSNGQIVGYGGGSGWKERLLQLEGISYRY